jgi:hypothetical protein
MGISPVHFCGAAGSVFFPLGGACSDVWWQQAYQGSDKVSREDLARAIAEAEREIADFLGYWPAPMWFEREMHKADRHHRREWFGVGVNTRYDPKSVKLDWGKFIAQGRRNVTLIGAMALTASDPDGDGFNELYTGTRATTLTQADIQEVAVYFTGKNTEEWEVRPKTAAIVAGTLTCTFDFWQVIDPVKQDVFPSTAGQTALDITGTIYVASLDVYRRFTDYSLHSSELYWEPREYGSLGCPVCGGSGCQSCSTVYQCGCLHVRDVSLGIAVPVAADWNPTTSAWVPTADPMPIDPDMVKVWYQAGDMSQAYLAGTSLDPLDQRYAECIAYLAVSRLERPFCACGNLASLAKDLRQDYSRTDSGGPSFYLPDKDASNPFGTRKGELVVWRRLTGLAKRAPRMALV